MSLRIWQLSDIKFLILFELDNINIVADLLGTFCGAIKYNKDVILNKINISKEGFKYFKKGGLTTVLFILVFLCMFASKRCN